MRGSGGLGGSRPRLDCAEEVRGCRPCFGSPKHALRFAKAPRGLSARIRPSRPAVGALGHRNDLRSGQDGFSLVEVIVALALFALIGVAGYSMLSGILQTQERTGGRLERLAEIQRALFVITSDLDQADSQPQGGSSSLALRKQSATGRSVLVRYDLQPGGIVRTVSGDTGESSQRILSGVGSLSFGYFRKGSGWSDEALGITEPDPGPSPEPSEPGRSDVSPKVASGPPLDALQALAGQEGALSAIAIDLELVGVDGRQARLRRIVNIPEIQP